jgi:Immunoglobulin domain/Purple acid Phosphatase, N-terminal domain
MSFASCRTAAPTLLALVFLGWLQSAPAALRDGGIDPANMGRGSWIYILPTATAGLGGNVPAVSNLTSLMVYVKNQGLQYIVIKAAQADTVFTVGGNPQLTPAVVAAAHAAGLKLFGYLYTTGQNVPGEIDMADYIFQQGADGLIYDAEIEWESVGGNAAARSALATQLCSAVRSRWPNKFMGLSTWPYRALHPNLPYKEFAYYCDVIMPQAYWIELGDTPTACVARVNSEWNSWKNGLTGIWTNAIKPFIMTGQGWSSASGTVTAAQITEFENGLRSIANPVSPGGFKAVDYWRAELHPASIWEAIRTNFLGNPYTNAPVIQVVPAATASATTANISWPTDQVADGVVEYGLASSYGNATTNATLLWYHMVNLSGLSPDTTYHYRVKSKGTNNLTGVSADDVFTTTTVTVADIILDQDPANNSAGNTITYLGSWTANVSGSAYLGSFRYASCIFNLGAPDRTARFIPNIVTAGNYDVYASWAASTAGGNRCTNAPFRIYNGSVTATRVSQEANGNSFQLIASHKYFPAGTASYVELGNDVTASIGGDIVVADAVKLVYIPPLPSAPSIITPPQNLTVNQGNPVTFTVSAAGTAPLSYQWQLGTTNIPGATASSYEKFNAQPADAGTYSVVITNAFGSTNSANVLLAVQVPPSITAQPLGQVVYAGSNVTFTVTATGTPAPAYQWRFNGTNLSGATTDRYTRNGAQASDAGDYSVVVTNAAGSLTSANALLTVNPWLPVQFQSITRLPDGRVQFVITGNSNATLWIDQSPSLPPVWLELTNLLNPGGTVTFTDDGSTNYNQRFYRARQ